MHEIDRIRADSHRSAYEALKAVNDIWNSRKLSLQIVTAESLTGGMIFSTLVDIPYGGGSKYGCFGVYDTDAKRVSLGVTEPNVYTHNCVKQMAVGALLNSNASIAVAVSGNAMPDQEKPEMMRRLGEVFIGVAGYRKGLVYDGNNSDGRYDIIVSTKVYNLCEELETCKLWAKIPGEKKKLKNILSKIRQECPTIGDQIEKGEGGDVLKASIGHPSGNGDVEIIDDEGATLGDLSESAASGDVGSTREDLKKTTHFAKKHIGSETLISKYNDSQLTSMISMYIRHATTKHALDDCAKFIFTNRSHLVVPDFVTWNRIQTPAPDNKLLALRVEDINKPYYIIDSNEIDTRRYDMTKKGSDVTDQSNFSDIFIEKRTQTNNKTLSYPEKIAIICLNDYPPHGEEAKCKDTKLGAPYSYYPGDPDEN
jgi:nicotinamide mononucleotide (NMN) deamidase PncC